MTSQMSNAEKVYAEYDQNKLLKYFYCADPSYYEGICNFKFVCGYITYEHDEYADRYYKFAESSDCRKVMRGVYVRQRISKKEYERKYDETLTHFGILNLSDNRK